MKTIALINKKLYSSSEAQFLEPIDFSGTTLHCGIIDIAKPHFDSIHESNKDFVLVKVKAFSCNYRDKVLILKATLKMSGENGQGETSAAFFGSDFVGTIVEKGRQVTEFSSGDIVIPDCSYPEPPALGVAPGVVTNEASRGWLRLHKSKLIKIPKYFDYKVAAGFSIGGQTSQSMIRRASIQKGENVLVLSARSNTSLFIINALLKKEVDTTILSTTKWTEEELNFVRNVKFFYTERKNNDWPTKLGKFDVIFDPFYDIHLLESVKHLKAGGRYITCGYKNQHNNFKEQIDINYKNQLHQIMMITMINNLSIIGNCIGTKKDLKQAIDRYDCNFKPFPIEATYTPEKGDSFLYDTYNKKGRFGKIIMRY